MTLPDLITRLEGATEGSRELDAAALSALGYHKRRAPMDSDTYWAPEPPGTSPFTPLPESCERPTRSLDAALELCARVLPGWCRSVVDLTPEPCEGYVWERGHVGNIQGKGATPALALLLALLNAVEAQTQSQETSDE